MFVIGDTTGVNATDALLSLSATAPTLPAGYDVFRRLGWLRNDSSSNIRMFLQTGTGRTRWHWLDIGGILRVLTNGSAIVFTNVGLSSFVPTTARVAQLLVEFRAGTAGVASDTGRLRPDTFTAGAFPHWLFHIGLLSGLNMSVSAVIACPGQIVEYRVTAGGASGNRMSLSVSAWEDEL